MRKPVQVLKLVSDFFRPKKTRAATRRMKIFCALIAGSFILLGGFSLNTGCEVACNSSQTERP